MVAHKLGATDNSYCRSLCQHLYNNCFWITLPLPIVQSVNSTCPCYSVHTYGQEEQPETAAVKAKTEFKLNNAREKVKEEPVKSPVTSQAAVSHLLYCEMKTRP